MRVYNFGSINIDHVYRVPHLVQPGETLASDSLDTVLGGKGANQSVALARAGCEVIHIGQIGEADSWAKDQLSEAGVDTTHVNCLPGPSGHAIIQVDDEAENSIILHGGANQCMDSSALESVLGKAKQGDWLLMQNECNAIAQAFDIAQRQGLRVVLNPAPMTPSIRQLPLERCRILIVNETEALALADTDDMQQAMRELEKRYPETRLVLTMGSKGAMMSAAGETLSVPAFAVDAVDTTGAGDTFVGYFLAGLVQQESAENALRKACAAAALSVSQAGATPTR